MSETLSKRQKELLTRVCLKRYEVRKDHYMGSFQPNESITVYDVSDDGPRSRTAADNTFRISTLLSLLDKGLVHYKRDSPSSAEVKPTRAGLDLYAQIKN